MKSRDERVALMNEVLPYCVSSVSSYSYFHRLDTWRNSHAQGESPIYESYVCPYQFSQFMAWERSFESRVMKIRVAELKYQRLNYTIEVSIMMFLTSRTGPS
jgi:hypothetical protein